MMSNIDMSLGLNEGLMKQSQCNELILKVLLNLQGLVIGLYDDQECDDIIIERRPWESVKSGPSGEIAISSRYAIFYRKGSLDDIDATDNFGDKDSVKSLYPPCHWIFDIPEGN